MKTNSLPDPGKTTATQQELLAVIGGGGVCEECLNEDFDSCVCPESED